MEGDELEIKSKAELVIGKVIKFLKSYGPFLFFVGFITTGICLRISGDKKEKELSSRGVKTIGVLYDWSYRKGYTLFTYFKVNGKNYSTVSSIPSSDGNFSNGVQLGSQYEVTYLPESPRNCRVDFSKPIPFKSREHYEKVMKLLDSLDRVKFNNWKSAD